MPLCRHASVKASMRCSKKEKKTAQKGRKDNDKRDTRIITNAKNFGRYHWGVNLQPNYFRRCSLRDGAALLRCVSHFGHYRAQAQPKVCSARIRSRTFAQIMTHCSPNICRRSTIAERAEKRAVERPCNVGDSHEEVLRKEGGKRSRPHAFLLW